MNQPIRPTGPAYRFWRRQRNDSQGRGMFPAPIYVMTAGKPSVACWYSEDGIPSTVTHMSVSDVLAQCGVQLGTAPWDADTQLPDGF